MAQDKYATRLLEPNVFCQRISTAADLDALLHCLHSSSIPFPLIVKPVYGWASEGVCKVHNEESLQDAVKRLWQASFTAKHGREVVVESYVDGPEIDANMVLVDGEVIFYETNDEFPSPGDKNDFTQFDNFVEISNMIPSALPKDKIEVTRQKLHESALKMVFRNGVFHMEARVRDSAWQYEENNGLMDLLPKPKTMNRTPDTFLLEANPRAPGMQETAATARAYGVSYRSLGLLNAIADWPRMKALSVPFCGGA